MPAISIGILDALGDVVRTFHTTLRRYGTNGIKSDLANWTNPFGLDVVLGKWDDILGLLDKLAVTLKKGNIDDIIDVAKDLSKSIADIQMFLLSAAAQVGSFIPGPIGIVCSLALAVGCFAVGDIPGGLMNLVGAIPGAKLAKYIPIDTIMPAFISFRRMLCYRFGYNMSELTQKIGKSSEKAFKCIDNLNDRFAQTIKKAKANIDHLGDEITDTKKQILTKIDDGWNAAREELNAVKVHEYMLTEVFRLY